MSALDARSLIVVAGLLGLLCSAILFMMRRSFPPTIGGLNYWSWGLFGMVLASALFGLTGHLPRILTVVLANAMMMAGVMSFYAGFRHFAGRPVMGRLLAVVLFLATCYIAWFTYGDDKYAARSLLVAAIDTVLFFACTYQVSKTGGDMLAGRFTASVFAAIGIISAIRTLMLLFQVDTPSDVFSATPTQLIYLASLAFAVLAVTLGAMMMANERLRKALEFIASHDQLTDAYSRRAFIDLLSKEAARSTRSGRPLALLMFDLDNFKSVNDRFGHAVGDRVIIDFARRTGQLLRASDSLGRYGGEEFIALLPDATMDDALSVAQRICRHVAEQASPELPRYTVSIGVAATTPQTSTVDALLSNADRALYRAKNNGRNRVEAA